MVSTFKKYKKKKIAAFTKTENIFFIFQSVNKNSKDLVATNQNTYKLKLRYNKIVNKSAHVALNESTLKNTLTAFKNIIIFLKPNIERLQKKKVLIRELKKLNFHLLFVKINNKIYSIFDFKTLNFLSYKNNFIVLLHNTLLLLKRLKVLKKVGFEPTMI